MKKSGIEVYGDLDKRFKEKIVIIHPLADETHILTSLKIKSEDCRSCDFYWQRGDELVFVGVSCCIDCEPMVSFYKKEWVSEMSNKTFFVRTRSTPIDSSDIKSVLKILEHWILENYKNFKNPKVQPQIIFNSDILDKG